MQGAAESFLETTIRCVDARALEANYVAAEVAVAARLADSLELTKQRHYACLAVYWCPFRASRQGLASQLCPELCPFTPQRRQSRSGWPCEAVQRPSLSRTTRATAVRYVMLSKPGDHDDFGGQGERRQPDEGATNLSTFGPASTAIRRRIQARGS